MATAGRSRWPILCHRLNYDPHEKIQNVKVNSARSNSIRSHSQLWSCILFNTEHSTIPFYPLLRIQLYTVKLSPKIDATIIASFIVALDEIGDGVLFHCL
uniref:Uncharacterized protein n=1 Tax=Physcomitrium patens TaxID=3218 RepID=A0A2K1L8R9_PHYPA|nr:hypothetical protein PHYPA_000828 [Physcomitrium patens]